jgi:hypothetical protein
MKTAIEQKHKTDREWRTEKRRYEVVDATGTPIMEVVGTWDEARAECQRIGLMQNREMYLRGK